MPVTLGPNSARLVSLDGASFIAGSGTEHWCSRCDGTHGDPLAAAFALGSTLNNWRSWVGYSAVALILQAVIALGSVRLGLRGHRTVIEPQPTSLELDITQEPPRALPVPMAEKEEPALVSRAIPPARLPEAPSAPVAAAARASAVVTAIPDPNEPVDLTGNTVVVGDSDRFAGGSTMTKGTSDTAVRSRAVAPRAVGVLPPVAVTATTRPAEPDKSRPVQYAGGSDWNCPFPAEADTAQIDDRFVTIKVTVAADSALESVVVLDNGDHGFARAADNCSRRHAFGVALDHDGHPIAGTKTFRVHFER